MNHYWMVAVAALVIGVAAYRHVAVADDTKTTDIDMREKLEFSKNILA